MKRIKVSTYCPRQLIKKTNDLIKKGYHALSDPKVLFDCNTNKVSYHQILSKK